MKRFLKTDFNERYEMIIFPCTWDGCEVMGRVLSWITNCQELANNKEQTLLLQIELDPGRREIEEEIKTKNRCF